jgi:hypothetical protein
MPRLIIPEFGAGAHGRLKFVRDLDRTLFRTCSTAGAKWDFEIEALIAEEGKEESRHG